MYVETQIDSLQMEVFFDTGCLMGYMISKSFAQKILDKKGETYVNDFDSLVVDTLLVAGFPYSSNIITVVNDDREYSYIAPTYSSDRRIWRFDLDSCRLAISDSAAVNVDGIQIPIVFAKSSKGRRIAPFVKLPLVFCSQHDTLVTEYHYLLDTGTPYGVLITDPTEELRKFSRKCSHMEFVDEQFAVRPNWEIGEFYPNILLDTVCIPDVKCNLHKGPRSLKSEFRLYLPKDAIIVGTVGMRILKHFNFTIDLGNECLALVPTKSRFPSKKPNRFDFWCKEDGSVRRLGVGGVAEKAGLALGDKVVSINDVTWEAIGLEAFNKMAADSETLRVVTLEGKNLVMTIIENEKATE